MNENTIKVTQCIFLTSVAPRFVSKRHAYNTIPILCRLIDMMAQIKFELLLK